MRNGKTLWPLLWVLSCSSGASQNATTTGTGTTGGPALDSGQVGCAAAPCSPHALCTPQVAAPGYTCACLSGYAGDGVTCASLCGDGVCEADAGESCTACPSDCGSCACAPCSASAPCASGTCEARSCDGLFGCFPAGASSTCLTIGGAVCPKSAVYAACTSDSDCCADVNDAGDCLLNTFCVANVCRKLTCTSAAECAPAPEDGGLTTACSPQRGPCESAPSGETAPPCTQCALACTPGSTCPTGQSCSPYAYAPDAGSFCQ